MNEAAVAPTSVKDAYRFFVPLMFMAELMMISHAVIAAFLARMDDPASVLAAYSVAFYFHATLGSPVWACQIVFLSWIRDRASMRRLALFGLQTVASVAWIWLAFALTPLGDWFFTTFFGLSEAVAREAQLCLLVGLAVPPLTVLRSLSYALLMVKRRTAVVTLGTVIRLLGLAGLLAVLTRWFEGAVVGVIALVGCIAIESLFAGLLAARYYQALEPQVQAPPGYRELWRFSWPIMMMQTAESGVAFTVNFFLGRLPSPELALAAFGVLDSLMRLLLSPLRNLVHTTQTLVRTRADARSVLIFTAHMSVLFGSLTLAFHIPAVRNWALIDVMGLPPEMAEYITPALRISVALALAMAAAAITRGLLIASKNTGAIAVASTLRIAAVLVTGGAAIWLGIEDGAMVGIVALIFAFVAEAGVLSSRLLTLDRRQPRLFTTAGDS